MLNVHFVADYLLGFYRTNKEHFYKRTMVYFFVISLRVKLNLHYPEALTQRCFLQDLQEQLPSRTPLGE